MANVENRLGIEVESLTGNWPKTIDGFVRVVADPWNPLFEGMAEVIEGPSCRRALKNYRVKGLNNGEYFCPISRKPSEARRWVRKIRDKRAQARG